MSRYTSVDLIRHAGNSGRIFLSTGISRSAITSNQSMHYLRQVGLLRRRGLTPAAVAKRWAHDMGSREQDDFMWTPTGADAYSRRNLAEQKKAMIKNPEQAFQVRLDDDDVDSAYASLFPAVSANNLMFFPQATAKALALPDAIEDRINDDQVLAVRDAKRDWDSIVTKLSQTGINGIMRDDVTLLVNLLPVDVRSRRGEELMGLIKVFSPLVGRGGSLMLKSVV
ncbi:hypothetical protein V1517DRAFT_73282 [Lipomyces orientalis]|uniref:Uncharacterized protein n=1 Tax=Lipomyces orientalis TaxID=1233043 RepID=A0ACC3TSH1_9ASCO